MIDRPIEVHLSLGGGTVPVGRLHITASRGRPLPRFEYVRSWLENPRAFSIDPDAPLSSGPHYPSAGREFFGAIGDSAPDQWGRNIMRRRERRRAEKAGERPQTLFEPDYLMGVSDIARMGALRFRFDGEDIFQAPLESGVPSLVALRKLLDSADRIERGEETDEDITLLFCQGSSLGGARPKASIKDQNGNLAIAKFPKETDKYSVERWESIALTLAAMANINVAKHQLVPVNGREALLSQRFDREGERRIPFMSAMARLQAKDGEGGSYLDIIDEITENGASAATDRAELFRRVAFNILISNVDDHLRNHGFLYRKKGWVLAPAYDLNPMPTDLKERILSTSIDHQDRTCSLLLLMDTVEYYSLSESQGRKIIAEVAAAVNHWRDVAKQKGASDREIDRMSSAFEHEEIKRV